MLVAGDQQVTALVMNMLEEKSFHGVNIQGGSSLILNLDNGCMLNEKMLSCLETDSRHSLYNVFWYIAYALEKMEIPPQLISQWHAMNRGMSDLWQLYKF